MNAKTAPSRIFKSGENGRIFDFYVFRERAISCHIVLAEAFARHETTYQSQSRKPIGAEPTARLLLGDLRAETLAHLLSASASAASADRASAKRKSPEPAILYRASAADAGLSTPKSGVNGPGFLRRQHVCRRFQPIRKQGL
jgi:hypothetical protein